jgi:5'-methylthioadenosine phosphorylase
MTGEPLLGIIGGSGLYQMDGLEGVEEIILDTPFGAPSGAYLSGRMGGRAVVFLARHGSGHRILPTELNFRANIHGFRQLGADAIISVSAVGSLREEIKPGHMVVPAQFIDRSYARPSTFFGEGIVAHVSFADPVCPQLSSTVAQAAVTAGAKVHSGGTYVCMEGPQFSTRAESHLYRSWGGDVIGMTNLQEAKLAREAEICFATLAMATDYDCWREDEEGVAAGDIISVLAANVAKARETVAEAAGSVDPARDCGCRRALDGSLVTDPSVMEPATKEKLAHILDRVMKEGGV